MRQMEVMELMGMVLMWNKGERREGAMLWVAPSAAAERSAWGCSG